MPPTTGTGRSTRVSVRSPGSSWAPDCRSIPCRPKMRSRSCSVAARLPWTERHDRTDPRAPPTSHGGQARRLQAVERAKPIVRAPSPLAHGVPVVADHTVADTRDLYARPFFGPRTAKAMSGTWDQDEAAAFVEA